MKILVTGATGFIGNKVIEELLNYDHKIIATSRDYKKAQNFSWYNKVKYISYDLNLNNKNLFSFFEEPEILIHLAWDNLSDYNNPIHLEKNLMQNYFFLKEFISSGIKNINITGTCFEYGLKTGLIKETTQANPVISYGIAKFTLLKFIEFLSSKYKFNYKWIRLFYIYGKNDTKKSLIYQLENSINNNEEYFNMSGGEQIRDYLSVEKVAKYIVKISLQDKIKGIINCGSGQPVKLINFVNNYLKENKLNIKLKTGFYPYNEYESMAFWSDTKKLNKILKYD